MEPDATQPSSAQPGTESSDMLTPSEPRPKTPPICTWSIQASRSPRQISSLDFICANILTELSRSRVVSNVHRDLAQEYSLVNRRAA